ncbi:hypothetical protein OAC86_00325 [bacterium]|nr:hypothetical protein [bacterium]
MNTNNSISSTIKQLLEINVNSLKTFERINEAITTSEQNVPLEILTSEGGTKTVYVPSFGFMKKELERLDTNLKALSGLGIGNSTIRLADGSFQKVITSALKTPASDITVINRPTTFDIKSNYFFEDFLNPLLVAKFDITGQIPNDTERVLIKRFIFDSTDQVAVDYFDDNFINTNDITYTAALAGLTNNKIGYTNDEEVRDMPYRNSRYYGKFDVTAISDSKREVIIDGVTKTKPIKLYTLDQLTYSDSNKELDRTEVIKPGDELMVNSLLKNTRYKITKVDGSQVELELVEGFEPIKITADSLAIYKNVGNTLEAEINVGFNERMLIFIKAIDPVSKMLAEQWSPGVGFYSNDLEITREDGVVQNLAEYYADEVADFGRYIKALKDDAIPPATQGIIPDAPVLIADNFKVVQVNKHLTESDAAVKIKKLVSDKASVEEAIKKLDDTISKKRSEIATKLYASAIQSDSDKNELAGLIDQRSSEASLYSSIVTQIQSLSTDTNIGGVAPKYRVRGFWSIPFAKTVAGTMAQNVVQFFVQYRYVSTSGKTPPVSQLTFLEDSKEKTAIFSNWSEVKTTARSRAKDADGKFRWQDSKVEDGEAVNFNQLDISISQGEAIEIRVKSISEAGYPANPILSDWSEPVSIPFPVGEVDTTDINALIQQNISEVTKVKLNEELAAQGVFTHVAGSFTSNENFYAHTATDLASGFLSPEQKPVSVFDKLTELQLQISALQEQIENTKGELLVKLIAEDGTVTIINKDTTNQIFAGYYTDEVSDLTVKKGHIVTKTFKLVIENTKATTLELISRLTGDRKKPAYKSATALAAATTNGFGNPLNDAGAATTDNRIVADTYYTTEGMYDLVPIQYQNISSTELSSLDLLHDTPYQSAQRRGQFIYSRFMDISGTQSLYNIEPIDTTAAIGSLTQYEHVLGYADFESSATPTLLAVSGNASDADFIWAGTFGMDQAGVATTQNLSLDFSAAMIDVTTFGTGNITASQYNSSIYLHKEHPDLQGLYADLNAAAADPTAVTDGEQQVSVQALVNNAIHTMPISAAIETSGLVLPYQISGGITLANSNILSKKQLGYMEMDGMIAAGDRSFKMSFDANDQYLLGGKSVGAFLFLAPINMLTLRTDGETRQSTKKVLPQASTERLGTQTSSNSVSLDVVFQYRMTDYFGNDSSTDIGRIGGFSKFGFGNLTYTKTIGLDIFDKSEEQFSFDIEVFAKYSPRGKNLNSIRAAQLVR